MDRLKKWKLGVDEEKENEVSHLGVLGTPWIRAHLVPPDGPSVYSTNPSISSHCFLKYR